MTLDKLKKNREFKNVYEQGRSVANKYLVLYITKNNLEKNRIGFSISKKVGNAVKRNRMRRLLTEAGRKLLRQTQKGWDMVIIVRPRFAEETDYKIVYNSFVNLLKKSGLYKEED